ncbi:MAG: response regulator [bacterium]
MKILIIDDDQEVRTLIHDTLKGAGYINFLEADNGLNGMHLVESTDLILTDLHMPGMSGGSLIREVRSNPRTEKIPIIAITSDSSETTVHRILREGIEDYIIKPFDTQNLIEKVNRVRDHLLKTGQISD